MRAVQVRWTVLAAVLAAAGACSDAPTSVRAPTARTAAETPSGVTSQMTLADWLAARGGSSNQSILAGAGDIAECIRGNDPRTADPAGSAAAATAALLDQIPGSVITIGDNAYPFGTLIEFMACYEPTWGRHKERTFPSLGNHEYMSGGSGYFAYFGPRAGSPLGYYSYNVGRWHVVVLNSTPQVYLCRPPETEQSWPPSGTPENPVVLPEPPDMTTTEGRLCAGDAAQQAWLLADLMAHRQYRCTLVYFHHARYSSGRHGNHAQMQRMWDIMWLFGVDVALTAHDHNYERFAPQDLNGRLNNQYGIREFVVGTGGAHLREAGPPIPNSEVVIDDRYGVIALDLRNSGYDWAFVATDGTVLDSGSGDCHGRPPRPHWLPT